MKKNKLLTLSLALLLGLGLASCDNKKGGESSSDISTGEETSTGDTSSEETANMTASYCEGRIKFHEITGIWLPELENIELLESSSFSYEYQTACFDFLGDKTLFDTVYAYMKKVIPSDPLFEDSNGGFWEYIDETGTRNKKYNFDVSFDPENEAGSAIYINGMVRDYYSVTLTAGTGGSVTLKMGSKTFDNNVASVTPGDNLILTATPDANYDFAGWYKDNQLLSLDNPYTYEAEKKDVVIEGRFEEATSNMTPSYKEARNQFYKISGILLPQLEDVTTEHEFFNEDEQNHVRDEASIDIKLPSLMDVSQTYAEIKAAVNGAIGNPEESLNELYIIMDQWSIPYKTATIPYRVEAMMNAQPDGTTIYLMWRRQPIVNIYVTSEGPGEAYGVYINNNYEEVPYTEYWEIVDAFHGTLVAKPNEGKEFLGWYVDNVKVSDDARYVFSYKNVDFTEITFVAKFGEPAPVEMTESYASARSSFQTFSGITLPELSTVTAMFEELGPNQCMVDINKANSDIFSAVKESFTKQTGVSLVHDNYGKDVWNYTKEKDDGTYSSELSCFLEENMIVIMYEERLVESSYLAAREAFKVATGITLPVISDLEADIMIGTYGIMLDIVGGDNLNRDTYDNLIDFFNYQSGYEGYDDTHDDSYPTMVYSNSSTGSSFQVVWNGESSDGGIYINIMKSADGYDSYETSKAYFLVRFGITLPNVSNVAAEFYCDSKLTCMTFDLTKANNFTEEEYNQFVNVVSNKFGNGTDASDDNQKRTTWNIDGKLLDVVWDLTTGLAINLG